MLSKVTKWVLVFLLCMSLGFHWGLLQSVAWVGMMVNYSCQGSLKEAVVKTFDGQHPCSLCKLVREGKKNEKKSDSQQNVKQIDLFADNAAGFYFPSGPQPEFPFSPITLNRSSAPPSPPPRPFFG